MIKKHGKKDHTSRASVIRKNAAPRPDQYNISLKI